MIARDLVGQVFGRLIVVHRAGSVHRKATWLCHCECGNECVVETRKLTTGNTRSCGCLRSEVSAARARRRNTKVLVGYMGAHRRVVAAKGDAKDHRCVDCSQPAGEWSYDGADPHQLSDTLGRAFSLDPVHYSPRCVSCHRVHDYRFRALRNGMPAAATSTTS